ncbi:MAG: hypothetical protein ACAI35_00200 [Candidatus Methylacidiphilales bacterium]
MEIAELRAGAIENEASEKSLLASGETKSAEQQKTFAKNKKDRADLLEKTLEDTVARISKTKVNTSTFDIIYLAPKRYIIRETFVFKDTTKDRKPIVIEHFCNEGHIFSEHMTGKSNKVNIAPYKEAFLIGMAIGIPAFAMDEFVRSESESFIFNKTQQTSGVMYNGTLKKRDEELSQEVKDLVASLGEKGIERYTMAFDNNGQPLEIRIGCEHAGYYVRTYRNNIQKEGVSIPEFVQINQTRTSGLNNSKEHFQVDLTLLDFHKLNESEIKSISTAYTFKPGYAVSDSTGPELVQTTSDEILKKMAASQHP